MSRGLSKSRIGVTEAMVESFGPIRRSAVDGAKPPEDS